MPPDGRNISTAACNKSQVVVAVGSDLYLLEVKPGSPCALVQIRLVNFFFGNKKMFLKKIPSVITALFVINNATNNNNNTSEIFDRYL